MNHLGAEFGHLCGHIRLGDDDPRADHPNPFERPEPGDNGRRGRPFELFYPCRDRFAEFLDRLLVFHDAFVMCHVIQSSIDGAFGFVL
jgi:hypothetical protein